MVGLILARTLSAIAIEPRRWRLDGTNAADYVSGFDKKTTYSGLPTVRLRSKISEIQGFGTLLQDVAPMQYQGKGVRFGAAVKTEKLAWWAGLSMRADRVPGQAPLGFDNMLNPPITGTCDWQTYDLVLYVSQEAQSLFFGVLLVGSGELRISDVPIQFVGPNVPVTGEPIDPKRWRRRHPDAWNLDFKVG